MRKRKMEKFAGKLSLSIRYGIGSARAPCPCPPSAEPRGFCPGFAALLLELVQLLLQIGSLLLKLLDLRIAVSDVGHAVLPAASPSFLLIADWASQKVAESRARCGFGAISCTPNFLLPNYFTYSPLARHPRAGPF